MRREKDPADMTDEELGAELLPNRPADHQLRCVKLLTSAQRRGYVELIKAARLLESGTIPEGMVYNPRSKR